MRLGSRYIGPDIDNRQFTAIFQSIHEVVDFLDIDSHPPIVYPVAIVSERKTPEVESLFKFLKGPEAKAIFEKHGFLIR